MGAETAGWGWRVMREVKKTHPGFRHPTPGESSLFGRTRGPGGLQLRILRVLPGVCSQQKHIESVANYEFSIHFILLPGIFSGDWSS